jgi:hypothetical protein
VQRLAGHLADALGDGPSVQRLKRDGLQDQEVNGALHEIGRFAHSLLSVTDNRAAEGLIASSGIRGPERWTSCYAQRCKGSGAPVQQASRPNRSPSGVHFQYIVFATSLCSGVERALR